MQISSGLFQTFHVVDSFPWVPSVNALCSAVCVQGGALTALLGRPIASATLLGLGSALTAWSVNKFRGLLLVLAFAMVFTLAVMILYMRAGGDGDEVAGSGRSGAVPITNSTADPSGFVEDNYPGIILLPELAPHTVLVPPLPFLKHDLFTERRSDPLSVPFSGVYWLFRRPQTQPPPDSHVVRGSPLTSSFRSTGLRTLSMEARQNFGTHIDLACCSKIQLAIRSADSNAGFITLELILTNTTLPGRPSLSLGKAGIASTQAVLSFDVPRRPTIREFDEATIVFHRTIATDRSSKVSIDRFVFIPRGL